MELEYTEYHQRNVIGRIEGISHFALCNQKNNHSALKHGVRMTDTVDALEVIQVWLELICQVQVSEQLRKIPS